MCSCDLCGQVDRCSRLGMDFGPVLICQGCVHTLRLSPYHSLRYAGAQQEAAGSHACDACLATGFLTDAAGRLVLCECMIHERED